MYASARVPRCWDMYRNSKQNNFVIEIWNIEIYLRVISNFLNFDGMAILIYFVNFSNSNGFYPT